MTTEHRAAALVAVAAGAAAGTGLLAYASSTRKSAAADEKFRTKTRAPKGSPVRHVAKAIAPLGKWYFYLPGAAVAAAYVAARAHSGDDDSRRAGYAGAAAVLGTGLLASGLAPLFDKLLPQPPSPPGHRDPHHPVVPSGHAFGPGAVMLAMAYVGMRERHTPMGVTISAATIVPLVTAGGKILEEKHWATDVLGGYLAGIAVAATCLACYAGVRQD